MYGGGGGGGSGRQERTNMCLFIRFAFATFANTTPMLSATSLQTTAAAAGAVTRPLRAKGE